MLATKGVESCCFISMIWPVFFDPVLTPGFHLSVASRHLAGCISRQHFAESDAVKVHWTPNRSALVTFRRGPSPIEAEECELDLQWQY